MVDSIEARASVRMVVARWTRVMLPNERLDATRCETIVSTVAGGLVPCKEWDGEERADGC